MTQPGSAATLIGGPYDHRGVTLTKTPPRILVGGVEFAEAYRQGGGRQDGPDAPAHAEAHLRDDDARRRGGHSGRADRCPSCGPAHDDSIRPGEGEPRPSRELHPRGLHGRSDLDRHAEALATLAGTLRRAFIGGVR